VATKKVIIIDTCNAGALGDAIQVAMMTRGMSEDTALKILSRSVGSTILSASTSVQESIEGYMGVFLLPPSFRGESPERGTVGSGHARDGGRHSRGHGPILTCQWRFQGLFTANYCISIQQT